jgi:hypothetical protein
MGGGIGYPSTQLFEEVAYIAYHFHWPYEQIMTLEHIERIAWVAEIAKINQKINQLAMEDSSVRSERTW